MTREALVGLFGLFAVLPASAQRPTHSAKRDTTAIVEGMKSDLRNLIIAQETFFADSVKYTEKIGVGGVDYETSPDNTIVMLRVTRDGWVAAIRNTQTTTACAIFIGSTAYAPAAREGEPACGPEGLLGQLPPWQKRRPPPGTYEFRLCYPSCTDSLSQVGRGLFVVVDGDIADVLDRRSLDDLEVLSWGSEPNACFRVSARREIRGREYYPGIIPVGLSSVIPLEQGFDLDLYRSPDAAFSVILHFDSSGVVKGQGQQFDWNGRGPVDFSVLSGRRSGNPDPQECFKPS